DPRTAHPHEDDVVEVARRWQRQPVDRHARGLVRASELFRHPAERLQDAQAVDRHYASKVGLTPSASAFAMSRVCSASSTASASSMSMIGMSSRTAYRRFRRGL